MKRGIESGAPTDGTAASPEQLQFKFLVLPDEAGFESGAPVTAASPKQLQLMFLVFPDEAQLRERRVGDGSRPQVAAAPVLGVSG